jgi:AraC family transcriptional regulator, transcriptional activator of pobA
MDINGLFLPKTGYSDILMSNPAAKSSVYSTFMPQLRAERVRCGLRDKILGLASNAKEKHWQAILLTTGTGVIETPDEIISLEAPCLAWLPWRADRKVRVRAGGVGFHISVGEEVLVGAVGNSPESIDMRYLADRRILASLEEEAAVIVDATHAFDLVVRELHHPRYGSWNMVVAQIRAVLVFLWRLSGVEDVALQSRGEPSRILQNFRQLVETRFRERWSVGAYADALKISHDRLHDICRRELGKTPIQLIHERVLHEARLRLERSVLTVDQVAASVGFKDVGHFSRFFKSKTGLPPGKFRKTISCSTRDGSEPPESTYADWP